MKQLLLKKNWSNYELSKHTCIDLLYDCVHNYLSHAKALLLYEYYKQKC